MAFDEILAERVRIVFRNKRIRFVEKKMFGGICFMVKDKMCAGIVKDELMARIDPDIYENALTRKGCREMDFSGRPMKGFVFVDRLGTDTDKYLTEWIQLALDYNAKAKSSKKK
jgi:TfoX/Sxy family transcriptional regulator of competence genes